MVPDTYSQNTTQQLTSTKECCFHPAQILQRNKICYKKRHHFIPFIMKLFAHQISRPPFCSSLRQSFPILSAILHTESRLPYSSLVGSFTPDVIHITCQPANLCGSPRNDDLGMNSKSCICSLLLCLSCLLNCLHLGAHFALMFDIALASATTLTTCCWCLEGSRGRFAGAWGGVSDESRLSGGRCGCGRVRSLLFSAKDVSVEVGDGRRRHDYYMVGACRGD